MGWPAARVPGLIQGWMDAGRSPLHSDEELAAGIWPRSLAVWIAALYMALFILRPWEQSSLAWLNEIHFERLYGLCMIVMAIFSASVRRDAHWRPLPGYTPVNRQNLAVGLFVAAIGLSTFLASNFDLAWEKCYAALTVVAFYLVLRLVVQTPYELLFLATCYVVAMGMYLMKAQWEYFRYGRHDYTMGVTRLIGIETSQGGPNALAISIVLSLPIWLFLYSARKGFTETWPSFWRKLFVPGLVAYFGLAISSLVMTRSRTGFVTFVVFLALLALRRQGLQRKAAAALTGLFVLGALWLVMSNEAKDRFRTIWNPEAGRADAYTSAIGRVEGFRAGVEMFSRYPFTGVGPGNFIPYRIANLDGVRLEAHNLAGQVLGETGFFGAATFAFMVAIALVNCQTARKLARAGFDGEADILFGFGTACRDTILLLLFEGLFDHNMTRYNWLWVAAFASVALRFAAAERGRAIRAPLVK